MRLYELYRSSRNWFVQRSMREKLFVILLGWAFLYGLFYFTFYRPNGAKILVLTEEIKNLDDQINSWNSQIAALEKIANTSLYKEWVQHHETFASLRGQYKFLLQNAAIDQWEKVMKAIIEPQPNIKIISLKNFPESPYNESKLGAATIYQQQLALNFYANYFDTITFLQRLESNLPNIHWDNLTYQVVQYPLAKVTLELSILYEKTS